MRLHARTKSKATSLFGRSVFGEGLWSWLLGSSHGPTLTENRQTQVCNISALFRLTEIDHEPYSALKSKQAGGNPTRQVSATQLLSGRGGRQRSDQ